MPASGALVVEIVKDVGIATDVSVVSLDTPTQLHHPVLGLGYQNDLIRITSGPEDIQFTVLLVIW